MYPRRRSIFVVALAALVLDTVLKGFDQVLHAMHPPGGVAGSVGALTTALGSSATSVAVAQGWSAWGRAAPPCAEICAPPHDIVAWWIVFDAVLGVLIGVTLGLWAKRRGGFLVEGSWIEQTVAIAAWGAIAYVVVHEITDLLAGWFVFYDSNSRTVAGAIGIVALLREVVLVLVVVPILLSYPCHNAQAAGAAGPAPARPQAPNIGATLRALRVPAVISAISVGVMLLLPGSVRPQLDDVVRMWFDNDGWHALWAVLGVVAFSVALFAACVIIQRRAAVDGSDEPAPQAAFDRAGHHVLVTFAIAGAAVIGLLAFERARPLLGAIALIAVVIATTSLPTAVRRTSTWRSRWADMNMAVARVIAIAPVIALALLVLGVTAFAGDGWVKARQIGLSLGLLGVAWALWSAFRRHRPATVHDDDALAGSAVAVLAVLWLAALGIAIAGRVDPLGVGWGAGAVTMVFVGLLAALGVLMAVEMLLWAPPTGSLAALRLTRVPIVALLVVLVVAESRIDSGAVFWAVHLGHDPHVTVDQGPGNYSGEHGISPAAAFDDYVATTGAALTAPSSNTVPIFVIASSGGGARSDYWTALTLDCLFANSAPSSVDDRAPACDGKDGRPRWSSVFVASGISGGSVGLAMYDAAHRSAPDAGPIDIDKVFARGFLDPTATSLVVGDLPNSLVRAAHAEDRARVLEESWEAVEPQMKDDFLAAQRTGFPLLMLNGADVTDGCRINVSMLRLASPGPPEPNHPGTGDPAATCHANELLEAVNTNASRPPDPTSAPLVGTRDVLDYVCPDRGDVLSYSTAALLSARFPYVSPTGALQRCDRTTKPQGGDTSKPQQTIYVVDGGYVDSSAASPLAELLDTLGIGAPARASTGTPPSAPCYQPVVLQIDNGYADSVAPKSPGRPAELIAPIHGFLAGGGHADNAEQALAELATRARCALPPGLPTFLHVYPRAHPGTTAPLGWSLSDTARDDMNAQLVEIDNQRAICNARRWLLVQQRTQTCDLPNVLKVRALTTTGVLRALPFGVIIVLLAGVVAYLVLQRRRIALFARVLRSGEPGTPTPTPRLEPLAEGAVAAVARADRARTTRHPRGDATAADAVDTPVVPPEVADAREGHDEPSG